MPRLLITSVYYNSGDITKALKHNFKGCVEVVVLAPQCQWHSLMFILTLVFICVYIDKNLKTQ